VYGVVCTCVQCSVHACICVQCVIQETLLGKLQLVLNVNIFLQAKYKKVYEENYKEYKVKLEEFYERYPDAKELLKR